MDEGEKPFPIELFVVLILVALANDGAEIFFDILDFTGVGVSGEAIMEPLDFILDIFFTGIFWWRVGFGGTPTIVQYIDDLLEAFLIPGRFLSVGAGMWLANHPNSALGKIGTTTASLATGQITGVAGEAENAAQTTEEEAAAAEKKLQGGDGKAKEADGTGRSKTTEEEPEDDAKSSKGESGEEKDAQEGDVFKNPYDNPVGTAGEELNEPPEEKFHEGEGFNKEEGGTGENDEQSRRVVDISSPRRAPPRNGNGSSGADNKDQDLPEAA